MSSKTVRIGDLVEGDRVRFPGGPDGPDMVYTINQVHKPGHGDCYVELGYPDGGRHRTAMHENEKAELVARLAADDVVYQFTCAACGKALDDPDQGYVYGRGKGRVEICSEECDDAWLTRLEGPAMFGLKREVRS